MGWLDRLFPGSNKPEAKTGAVPSAPAPAAKAATPAPAAKAAAPAPAAAPAVPPEKQGLNGEFDESGLAKRVALAFDNDATLDDVGTLWVAQLGSKVVLKGKVPDQSYLTKAVSIARGVKGATDVDADQVTVG